MAEPCDIHYVRHALRLAERGLGRTWPNPSVGTVIVRDGHVVGTGVTAKGGRPHAETEALAMAGTQAPGATLYVSLEPCAHQGKTPPCTKAIIEAGIARVVIACTDINPKVSGKGIAQLLAAGIEVEQGVCEAEARTLNEGFFSVIERKRPFITLKLATSLDGKITDSKGKSQWITGNASRHSAHALRAGQDAVLTGIGTVLTDDPELTCRLPGRESDSPQRIVLDSGLRISPEAKILPAWIFTSEKAPEKEMKALEKKGARIFTIPQDSQGLSLSSLLTGLAKEGITRLMVEAGSALAGAFIREKMADRLYWYRAPLIIGEKGMPALKEQDILSLSALPRYKLKHQQRFENDILEIYDVAALSLTTGH